MTNSRSNCSRLSYPQNKLKLKRCRASKLWVHKQDMTARPAKEKRPTAVKPIAAPLSRVNPYRVLYLLIFLTFPRCSWSQLFNNMLPEINVTLPQRSRLCSQVFKCRLAHHERTNAVSVSRFWEIFKIKTTSSSYMAACQLSVVWVLRGGALVLSQVALHASVYRPYIFIYTHYI